jgi:ribA/ribD-fused uncharacterized protein
MTALSCKRGGSRRRRKQGKSSKRRTRRTHRMRRTRRKGGARRKRQMGGERKIKYFNEAVGEHDYLSNFYPIDFEYNGRIFSTSEAAFSFMKALYLGYDEVVLQAIYDEKDPAKIKKMVSGDVDVLNKLGKPIRIGAGLTGADWARWGSVSSDIFYNILLEKFRPVNAARGDIRKKLLDTGNAVLVEAYWADPNWGIGYEESGEVINDNGEVVHKGDIFKAVNNIEWVGENPRWPMRVYEFDKDGNKLRYKIENGALVFKLDPKTGEKMYANNRLGNVLDEVRAAIRDPNAEPKKHPPPPPRTRSYANVVRGVKVVNNLYR